MEVNKLKNYLIKKDQDNNLSPEDLLKLVHLEDTEDLSQLLNELIEKLPWFDINDDLIIPLKRWAHIIKNYIDNGYSGLLEDARQPENLPFVLGVLEELNNDMGIKCISSLLDIYENDLDKKILLINSLNIIGSFRKNIQVEVQILEKLRKVIISTIDYLKDKSKDRELSICLLALRGIGNLDSIEYIKKLNPIKDKLYFGVEQSVIMKIKKNIK